MSVTQSQIAQGLLYFLMSCLIDKWTCILTPKRKTFWIIYSPVIPFSQNIFTSFHCYFAPIIHPTALHVPFSITLNLLSFKRSKPCSHLVQAQSINLSITYPDNAVQIKWSIQRMEQPLKQLAATCCEGDYILGNLPIEAYFFLLDIDLMILFTLAVH